MLEFPCESCGMLIKVAESQRNAPIICTNCNTGQQVPADATPVFARIPPVADSAYGIIVTTGNDIAGHQITEYLGIVRGIIVRTPSIGQGFMGGLRAIGGGNIPEFVAVCESARDEAYKLMLQHALQKGADALIAVRYDATEFAQGATEVLAYGTAVKILKG